MATETEVANLAAVRIGTASRITSLDDDKTVARTLKAVWAIERRAVLRDGSWNFNTARAQLPAQVLAGGVPYPWSYSFAMPADALRLREVLNLASRDDYAYEGGAVLCDSAGPLNIIYQRDVPELGLWDASAAEAFALRLAWKCGKKIAGSAFDERGCWSEYREAIGRAKYVDALENPPIPFDDGDWIAARMGAR